MNVLSTISPFSVQQITIALSTRRWLTKFLGQKGQNITTTFRIAYSVLDECQLAVKEISGKTATKTISRLLQPDIWHVSGERGGRVFALYFNVRKTAA